MNQTILVVEDEVKIADLVCKYLELENFTAMQAHNGQQALEQYFCYKPDLVVLDIMLPDMDGIEVCSHIRENAQTPVIMLTARVDEIDRLIGFAKGADDYVCKPFKPKELIARIHAVLRRSSPATPPHILKRGSLQIDTDAHSASIASVELNLTKIEFNLLCSLMQRPNKVFTREELLTSVQGKYSEGYERNIDTHIKNLRKKMNNESTQQNSIRSIYGVGYKLN